MLYSNELPNSAIAWAFQPFEKIVFNLRGTAAMLLKTHWSTRSFLVFFALTFALSAMPGRAEIIVIGGQGLSWEGGGDGIEPTVIRSALKVEHTNAPGGVIDFDSGDLVNWIFPQRADTTLNIAVGAASEDRGGVITSPNAQRIRADLPNMIDDDGLTALDLRVAAGQAAQVLGIIIDLDLGARFGINRFKFFPRNADVAFPAPAFPFQNDFMRGFELFLNDGTDQTQLEGRPIYETIALRSLNEESVVNLRIEPQYIRHIRLKSLTTAGFEIAEFQVFGTGFVPEAKYLSDLMDFGDLALFGNLRWVQASEGDGARSSVEVRTRIGQDADPVEYNKIRPGERIFRTGGGATSGNRAGTTTAGDPVPWKWADDVEDEELKTLVETVLDNEELNIRDAIKTFNELPLEQQILVTLEEAEFNKLKNEDKGGIREDLTNWSGWSPPYAPAAVVSEQDIEEARMGVPILAVNPRRYFQFSVDLISEEFEAATGVGALSFEVVTPPFAERIVGEISPREAAVGQKTNFTYAVRNQSRTGRDRGFDRFQINTPLRAEAVQRVSITAPDGSVIMADFSGSSLDALPLEQNDISIIEVSDNALVVGFPLIEADGTVLKIQFDAAVLRFGTTFTGQALNFAASETIGQNVVPGNAVDLGADGLADTDLQPVGTPLTGNLSVAVPIVRDLLVNVAVVPGAFSPNGDAINDAAMIQYDITNIARPTPVEICVYDLSGREVRRLYDALDLSGRFARSWDGRDDEGQMVPPGNYLVSVSLKAGTGSERDIGIVAVAY
jgi:hypothetical protein